MDFIKNIEQIEKTLGYTFRDKSLLKQAFTRESFCNENNRGKTKFISNEVLEFFGDSILSAAIVTLLMKDFAKRYEFGISTTLGEGDFSNIKSKLSDKKNLSLALPFLSIYPHTLRICLGRVRGYVYHTLLKMRRRTVRIQTEKSIYPPSFSIRRANRGA